MHCCSGLKRHAVTLFEGGRVAGEALMSEVTSELWASYAAGQGFEGDMARLTQVWTWMWSHHYYPLKLTVRFASTTELLLYTPRV
jgi:hypothetical protein